MAEELIEQLKQQLELKQKARDEKIAILKGMDTKKLIGLLPTLEEDLEKAYREESNIKNLNSGYLASQGSDCSEVKRLLAELSAEPLLGLEGKKATVAEREAFLILQRTKNSALLAAIQKQESVSFMLENNRISVEMVRRKMDNIRSILALRTAQINLLQD